MARVMAALRSPHVDILAHPAGRVVGGREDLDLDWDAVYAEAARTGTLLEVNGSDHRLDLADERARRAVEMGCLLTIDSDAHRVEELATIRWGVATARRGWVSARHVANAWSREQLLDWVARKPERLEAAGIGPRG
jgi:DNA polymerase (family 10)